MDNLNTINFLEPTKKYTEEWLESHRDYCREWFNADLIFWAAQFKSEAENQREKVEIAYKHWCTGMEVNLNTEELIEKFGDYSQDDFCALMKHLISKRLI